MRIAMHGLILLDEVASSILCIVKANHQCSSDLP